MRRRLFPIAAALVALAAAASPAGAQVEQQRIAAGVRAGGVDLSGMTVEEAATALRTGLGAALERPIVVDVAGRLFRLSPAQARVRFDELRTAKRAYYASRELPATPQGTGGAAAGLDVGTALTHSRLAVRAFAAEVDRAVYVAPRDARLRITVRRMVRRRSRAGRDLDQTLLAERISTALADPGAPRLLRARRARVRAAVTTLDLARLYPTVVTIDRKTFALRLFKRLRLRKTYGIAIGQAGLETPRGRFRITSRQVNPAWHVPNSAWAGSLAGAVIPGGVPGNPLKARWLGVAAGVGIHGTAEEWSIGSRASHGCIRMRVADVIDLYPRVPLGTPVLIR